MPNVLIIDDSKTVVSAVSRALAVHGFTVYAAETFITIPKLIDDYRPEVIVLDLNMPALTGEQVGKFLQRYNYKGKIVIYSGEREERLATTAATLGAVAWVSKDEPLGKLVEAIKACTRVQPQAVFAG